MLLRQQWTSSFSKLLVSVLRNIPSICHSSKYWGCIHELCSTFTWIFMFTLRMAYLMLSMGVFLQALAVGLSTDLTFQLELWMLVLQHFMWVSSWWSFLVLFLINFDGQICTPSQETLSFWLSSFIPQVSARQQSGFEIFSQRIKLEVYRPLKMHPGYIYLTPGASYTVLSYFNAILMSDVPHA